MSAPATAGIPADWLAAALAPPRAGGPVSLRGVLRATPEDFRVEELLPFEPDGGAAHLLLQVEKRDANTLFVARALARHAGLRAADVGFAGLKDRRALALQWFSVPARRPAGDWQGFEQPGFRVLGAWPHSRKLRRGALAGNRFVIVVRGLEGDHASLDARLTRLQSSGTPNYFGPQRFGREAANLAGLLRWQADGALPREREQRAFLFSAARALAFNAVLAARVGTGCWDRLLPGEVVNLAGSGSVFQATSIDAPLEARCAALDVHPTGPLPGRDGMAPSGEAAAVEEAALRPFASLTGALAAAGVEAARRPLRVVPGGLSWQLDGDALSIAFGLPRGAFATALLREVLELDAAALPGGDD